MKITMDIICQVYAGQKSKQTIDLVLDTFIPGYEKLNPDYTCPIHDNNYIFKTEHEMINYFIETPSINQTFYWHKHHDNPDKIMIGAIITDDNQLIISLTLDGTEETEQKYFNQLKQILQSNVGIVSYFTPADYEDGKDFMMKYS